MRDPLHIFACFYVALVVAVTVAAFWWPQHFGIGAIIGDCYVIYILSQGWRPWSPGFK